MLKIKNNYHTHCYRCRHADGTEEDYILAAIDAGYGVLGMSDHMAWAEATDTSRMQVDELDDYFKVMRDLQIKYQDQIKIYVGIEAEYVKRYVPILENLIKEKKVDYLVFGNHFHEYIDDAYYIMFQNNANGLANYLKDLELGIKTGLFSFIAHPDLYALNRIWDESCNDAAHKICQIALKYNLPIEYNCCGILNNREYPHPEFWKIAAKYQVPTIIGVDAHSPKHLNHSSINKAYDEVVKLGINLIEDLSIKINK